MSARIMQLQPSRYWVVLAGLSLVAVLLLSRAVYLHVVRKDFLQNQGDARHLRVMSVPAHRGMITDRHGEPLAVSTPVDSVWGNPQEMLEARARWPQLAALLGVNRKVLEQHLLTRKEREFVYLRRHVSPELARRVEALHIPGVALQREYRRYYPAGEVISHVLGFTSVDDAGQEGMELAFDEWMRGEPGAKRVLRDRLGRVVEDVENIRQPRPGRDLKLSIDQRLQYLAYRELKAAVQRHHADSGSAVILDVHTGEVLAMVNQPAFNPNNREEIKGALSRNRAVTDVFEPGSTVKPFTVAAAIEAGRFKPETVIDTRPGFFKLGRHVIRDVHNYGVLDVSGVITKSSNVGVTKISLATEPERLWRVLSGAGFGMPTGSGFPGEGGGVINHFSRWREIDRATVSYGYGMSATLLQLAQAYTVLANGGARMPVTMLAAANDERARAAADRVISPRTASEVRQMLETVVSDQGTALQARVAGYRVAGKTGTVRKSGGGGYLENTYLSVFAGMAPASNPRLVMAVMISDPQAGEYYGGLVAAPVFSRVMAGALRMMDIAPDDMPSLGAAQLAMVGDTHAAQ